MKIKIVYTATFNRDVKRLKRYKSIKEDFILVENDILSNPELGDDLGGGYRKIRFAIKSKGKGKRGGGRLITYTNIIYKLKQHKIYFLHVFDKSEKDSVTNDELKKLLKKNKLI